MSDNFYNSINIELAKLTEISRLRTLKTWTENSGKNIKYNEKSYVNLSSNDYLSIGTNKSLKDEFVSLISFDDYFTSSSSRLLTGNSFYYDQLEEILNGMFGKKSLIFNSGYHANLGIIQAIAGRNDLIISDKLNHASIIDGIKLSGAEFLRYKHLDYEQLENMLIENRNRYKNCFIISESLFSMDGTIADIKKLIELKNKYNSLLYIDCAHSFGVYGTTGLGLCDVLSAVSEIDLIVGTFGKAVASVGAFAITNSLLREFLVNKTRSLIFSTALPPVCLKWTAFILEKIKYMNEERELLLNNAFLFRKILNENGIKTLGNSFIIPIIIGSEKETVSISNKCMENGFYLLPIRPPTVPVGESRLRISMQSKIEIDDLMSLMNIIKEETR